ncbi:MAG: amidohydrolase family protein [Deltaproteobacteria bacterium]|nr:amidohydrolase family protein [Deltaproteobacteria bacterium]
MPRTYRVISGDGHIETPPEGWVKHVPAKYRDRAPRLIRLENGADGWLVEGQPMLHNGQNIKGRGPVKFANASYYNEDGSPREGAGDGKQRLREQDLDGIDAEVLFAPVFVARFIEGIGDRDAYRSIVEAYNTWQLEDYCAVAPDRLIPNALIPVRGLDQAIGELKRAHAMGFKSVQLQKYPNGSGAPKPEDDAFWRTALDLGIALSPHLNFGGEVWRGDPRADTSQWSAEAAMSQHTPMAPAATMAQMIVHGVFDRFPSLRFYFAELNCCYLPAMLFYLDRNYHEFNDWFNVKLAKEPSQYVLEHTLFGMIGDAQVLQMGHIFPLDQLIWGSDFPHSVGTYPNSKEYIAKTFDGMDEKLRRKILVENICNHLGLDPNAKITETPRA